MKKLLLTLLVLAVAFHATAQKEMSFKENSFLSLSGGMTWYGHEDDNTSGYNFSVGLGQWLLRPLAFRLAYDGVMAPSYRYARQGQEKQEIFHHISGEFLWDPLATFERLNLLGDHFSVYPIIGFGWARRGTADNDGVDNEFHTMLGLQVAWHKARDSKFDIFLEVKNFFLPYGFDGSKDYNSFLNLNLGLSYYWGRSYYRQRRPHESRSANHDWFAGFGGGAMFSSFEFEHMFDKHAGPLWSFTPEIMIGRNYSNFWTIRFELSGYNARQRYHEVRLPDGTTVGRDGMPYKFSYLHADFMVNLSNITRMHPGKRWYIMPYVGAGPIWRYEKTPVFNVAANAGLFLRRYLSLRSDFYIDLKYIVFPPRHAGGTGPSGSILGVGYPTLTIGYIHNFNHSTTTFRIPTGACRDLNY